MTEAKKSTTKYWIYFIISLAITLAMLIYVPAWFWVPLPFPITYFVLAMDWM
ncbi:MAG: hypothetical protein AAF806_06530 [Bacteroidota bacterium]